MYLLNQKEIEQVSGGANELDHEVLMETAVFSGIGVLTGTMVGLVTALIPALRSALQNTGYGSIITSTFAGMGIGFLVGTAFGATTYYTRLIYKESSESSS